MPDLRIRRLLPGDAAALGDLFRRCYGDTYGSPEFYDEHELTRRIDSGSLRSVVAVESGSVGDVDRLLGHTGMTVRERSALVCETGNTVVDPAARGQGLLKRLGAGLAELVRLEGFAGYVHFPTTAHPIMQKASVTNGGVETGVMLSYVPADTRYEAITDARESDAERLAATVAFQPLADAPARMVRLPVRYERLLRSFYSAANLVREVAPITRDNVTGGSARNPQEASYSARRGVMYAALGRADAEHFADWLTQLQAGLTRHEPLLAHADLPLDSPFIDEQILQLNSLGFFFSGLLPEFAHTDVLRLQRLAVIDERAFSPALANAEANLILQQVVEDARDVLGRRVVH